MTDPTRDIPQLSVVVPAHNEENNLAALHEAVATALVDISWELILIDDGSKDHTANVIAELAATDNRVKGIIFSRNFGKEAAMLAGLEAAQGENVAIMDADLQHPPQLLPKMLQKFQDNDVDQVIAIRDRTGDPKLRTFLSRMYYRRVNKMVEHTSLTDGAGDFRILSRRAVNALLAMREYKRFSKGLFSWIGFNTVTIEYRNQSRYAGTSSWSIKSLINYGIDGITSFNSRPLRALLPIGIAAALASLIYMIVLIIQWAIYGIQVPGYITLFAAITFFGSVQLISLGIIGEYVGKIYSEVKHRPHYLVKDIYNG